MSHDFYGLSKASQLSAFLILELIKVSSSLMKHRTSASASFTMNTGSSEVRYLTTGYCRGHLSINLLASFWQKVIHSFWNSNSWRELTFPPSTAFCTSTFVANPVSTSLGLTKFSFFIRSIFDSFVMFVAASSTDVLMNLPRIMLSIVWSSKVKAPWMAS